MICQSKKVKMTEIYQINFSIVIIIFSPMNRNINKKCHTSYKKIIRQSKKVIITEKHQLTIRIEWKILSQIIRNSNR